VVLASLSAAMDGGLIAIAAVTEPAILLECLDEAFAQLVSPSE
jgi:hypothetical protein